MAGVKKPTPREVFDEAMADAERLLAFARALTNKRQYRLRREMREAVAPALEKLRVPRAEWTISTASRVMICSCCSCRMRPPSRECQHAGSG